MAATAQGGHRYARDGEPRHPQARIAVTADVWRVRRFRIGSYRGPHPGLEDPSKSLLTEHGGLPH